MAMNENKQQLYPRYNNIIFISNKSIDDVFKDNKILLDRFKNKFSHFHLYDKDRFKAALTWFSALMNN